MSYNLQNVCACPVIQDALDGNFGSCNYDAIRGDDGFTQFLISPTNTNGALQKKISPGDGKRRTVELTFSQRYNPSHVTDSAAVQCEGGLAPSNYCEQFTLDPDEGSSWTISVNPRNYQEDCGKTMAGWVASEVQKAMAVLIWRIDQKNIETMSTNFGEFVSNGLVGPFPTSTKSTTPAMETSYKLIEDVTFESRENYYCSVPFVFGWGETFKYFQRVAAGCCADPMAMDLGAYARQNQLVFIPDRNVEEILEANHFFTVSAGAVQMLTWNEYEGQYNAIGDDSIQLGTLTDPFTGLKFDYHFKLSCADGVWSWQGQIKLAHKLVFIPIDIVAPDDPLYGANWTNHYVIENPA